MAAWRRRVPAKRVGEHCLTHWNGSWEHAPDTPPPYHIQAPAAVAPFGHVNPQSRHITESPMCRLQRSWQWQWRSRDKLCPFVRPTRSSLCARLANKRILLYGDSLTQQLFVSLASLAGGAAPMWRPSGCERMRRLDCLRLCTDSSEGGLARGPHAELCQRTKFGLALDEDPPLLHPASNCSIQPSVVAPPHDKFPLSCIRRFDIVLLSVAAHWVGVDGALGLQQCLQRQGIRSTDAARASQAYVAALYERQMRLDAEHLRAIASTSTVESKASGRRTRILFRTSPPGYPTADLLLPDTPNGTPPVFVAPSRTVSWARALIEAGASRFNHHMILRLNELARRVYADDGMVGLMDVEAPMLPRVHRAGFESHIHTHSIPPSS